MAPCASEGCARERERRARCLKPRVQAVQIAEEPDDWCDFARNWLREHKVPGRVAMLVAGPSERNPNANHRLEFLRLSPT